MQNSTQFFTFEVGLYELNNIKSTYNTSTLFFLVCYLTILNVS